MPRKTISSAPAMAVANDDLMDAVDCLVSLRAPVTKQFVPEQIPSPAAEVVCIDLTAVAYDFEADRVGALGPPLPVVVSVPVLAPAPEPVPVPSQKPVKRAKLYHQQVATPLWPFRTPAEVKTDRNYDIGVEIVHATMKELRTDITAAELSAANLTDIYEAKVAVFKQLASRNASLTAEWLDESIKSKIIGEKMCNETIEAKQAMLRAKKDSEKGNRLLEQAKERLQVFCESVDGYPNANRPPGSTGDSYISSITMVKRNVRQLMEANEHLKGTIKSSQYELHEANKMLSFQQTEIDRQLLINESHRAQINLNIARDMFASYQKKYKICKKQLDCLRTSSVVRMMV